MLGGSISRSPKIVYDAYVHAGILKHGPGTFRTTKKRSGQNNQ